MLWAFNTPLRIYGGLLGKFFQLKIAATRLAISGLGGLENGGLHGILSVPDMLSILYARTRWVTWIIFEWATKGGVDWGCFGCLLENRCGGWSEMDGDGEGKGHM